MKIRVLNGNRQFHIDAEDISDIKFDILDHPLNYFIGRSSDDVQIPVLDEILNREIFTGLKYCDVIDTGVLNCNNEIMQVSFRVKDNGDNSYSLFSNDSEVVEFELESPFVPNAKDIIPGNLLNADYEIHGKFYQCIHRTKDFIEVVAKNMAEEKGEVWEEYYGKALKTAIDKKVGKGKESAKKQWCSWYGIDVNNNNATPNSKYAKKNVEFRNFVFFVVGIKDDFNEKYGGVTRNTNPAETVIDVCKRIQGYRNDGSHSVYSLVYEEGEGSLCEAIDRMRTLVNRLGNNSLGGELELLKNEISALFSGKPNDLSINNH